MENQPFYSVLAHLSDFYDITLNENLFENVALHAWDHIGNKQYRLYRYRAEIKDHKIELPCNVDLIEGVFTNTPDWRLPENISRYDFSNYDIELYLNHRHWNTEAFYQFGKLLDYQRVGQTLIFEKEVPGHLTIVYKGVIVDDEGLPLLNFKEVDAIAKYCAWIEYQKKAMVTKDKNTFEMALMLRQQWQAAVEDARVPLIMNQNDFDKLLDVQSSWDRKRFGISFKPIR